MTCQSKNKQWAQLRPLRVAPSHIDLRTKPPWPKSARHSFAYAFMMWLRHLPPWLIELIRAGWCFYSLTKAVARSLWDKINVCPVRFELLYESAKGPCCLRAISALPADARYSMMVGAPCTAKFLHKVYGLLKINVVVVGFYIMRADAVCN